ncbi:MAG: chorismate mutase [Candidatus Nanohaloarchaea archaeon]
MSLEDYREEIDRINQEIADSIAERMEVVDKIGEYKRKNGMEMKDEGREEAVKQQFASIFDERNLPPERGREFAEKLIQMALDRERQ